MNIVGVIVIILCCGEMYLSSVRTFQGIEHSQSKYDRVTLNSGELRSKLRNFCISSLNTVNIVMSTSLPSNSVIFEAYFVNMSSLSSFARPSSCIHEVNKGSIKKTLVRRKKKTLKENLLNVKMQI